MSRAKTAEALREPDESSRGAFPKTSSFRAAQFCEPITQNKRVAIGQLTAQKMPQLSKKGRNHSKNSLKGLPASDPAPRGSCCASQQPCSACRGMRSGTDPHRTSLGPEPQNGAPRLPKEASESFCALARFWVSVVCFCELGAACSSPQLSG